MENINYTFNNFQKDVLSPDEVHFFYYDVMRDTENNCQTIYDWSNEIEKFLDEKGIIMEIKEKATLPQNVEKNELFFSTYQDESKPVAFFRHLRNAFAHHRITHRGEYIHIEDINGEVLTMKGLVKYQDLQKICFLFFNQRSNFENMNNL